MPVIRLLLVGLLYDVHTVLGVLCCQLQTRSLTFSDVQPLIDNALGLISHMLNHDAEGLTRMKAEVEEGLFYGTELLYYSEDTKSQVESVKQQYLDNLLKNIKKRLPKDDSKHMKALAQVLEPRSMTPSDDHEDALHMLAEHYGSAKSVRKVEGNMTDDYIQTTMNIDKLLDQSAVSQ